MTRRALFAGVAAGGAAVILPGRGWAQTAPQTTADGFRELRVAPGAVAPAIRAKRGDEVRVRFVNAGTEPSALHWHGVRLANGMDGVPGLTQPPVQPGASFDYRFTVRDAGTFWYRPATTATGQRMRGPHGALLVAESEPVETDLEALVLVDEIPNGDYAGRLVMRTNQRVRFRVINALPAALRLRFEKHRAVVMAIDGQPAEPFAVRDGRFTLAPGNRADIFVDAMLNAGDSATLFAESTTGDVPLLKLVYEGAAARPAPLPALKSLPPNPLPERMDFRSALRADVPLEATSLGRGAPLFQAKRGRTVMLALVNETTALQTVHLHGHSVRLLDKLDDGWKPFWLDTIPVPPQDTARIAFVADNPGKWLIESQTAAAWFEVT